jgi:UDP-glucose 4-epimerase
MNVLVTGGAGYIGSHTALALTLAGHRVVCLDNLCNASPAALDRAGELAGAPIALREADIRNGAAVRDALRSHACEAVVHFAGLKSVGESVAQPLAYYDNNVTGTLTLLEAMRDCGVQRLVFSSSATVYAPASAPLTEDAELGPSNPYGRTKLIIENILRDMQAADARWRIALLRYFNPVGAHPSGRIGEDPRGEPNNLMPYVSRVAVGSLPRLRIFGGDYATPDGTGLRDYVHVMDLAEGHVAALDALESLNCTAINLGTGRPASVLDVVGAFSAACGRNIPYEIVARRPGDNAISYADPGRARALLGWQATRGLDAMCADAWRWQSSNPLGYGN